MNFEFYNPTRLIFGAGTLSQLGEVVSKHGKNALIVTGGGSVKRSGVFDRAVASLKDAGVSVVECSGVEPNPRITSVKRGDELFSRYAEDAVLIVHDENGNLPGRPPMAKEDIVEVLRSAL